MRMQVFSDLHTEFRKPVLEFLDKLKFEPDLDFLVVAGDLFSLGYQGIYLVKEVWAFLSKKARHVIYITGNHEYYGTSFDHAHMVISDSLKDFPNIHWLNTEEITLDGVHIIGGTMWYPDIDGCNILYHKELADATQIFDFKRNPGKAVTEHHVFRILLDKIIPEKTIIVSHHMPSPTATPEMFRGLQSNRFFCADMTDIMRDKQPAYWIFGHTHQQHFGVVYNTKLVCYPLGYPGERNYKKFGSYDPVVLNV